MSNIHTHQVPLVFVCDCVDSTCNQQIQTFNIKFFRRLYPAVSAFLFSGYNILFVLPSLFAKIFSLKYNPFTFQFSFGYLCFIKPNSHSLLLFNVQYCSCFSVNLLFRQSGIFMFHFISANFIKKLPFTTGEPIARVYKRRYV